ncbi:low affinity sulfate transporter 3 isoform X2 [Mangifera indica]|uniref:low affinity sulfate transporter 3 isoform X2 n=1 Tax=Mangifera indica TaxID=29780 RepID=UPI001CFA5EBC|nr:low affinity sulfate transporter 3 isoform X2 [Mangifera indica]
MGSLPTETSVEEQQQRQPDLENSSRAERAYWLLNSPDPPGLWHELIGSIREIFFPGKLSSSNSKQPWSSRSFLVLQSLFPILKWGRIYSVSKFKHDLMAGLTLASLSIPQSIGYANLAKLDPQYGLYTSVVPPLIYALMGSSREIAIGPVAVVSMLLSSMIQPVVDVAADPIAYRKLVFTVTFFAGLFQSIFGLFRLGFLVDFLSHAAIVGFMAGAAIVIGLQQLKGLLGISHFTTKTDVISVLGSVFTSLHNSWYPLNFVFGCSFLVFLLFARFIGRRNKKLFWFPAIAPLLSVILSTFIVYMTRADKHGVQIVKHIKGGLNPSTAHQLQFQGPHLGQAAKIGLISAVTALTEAVAVGRSFASIKGYHLDGNKEMVAMGFMNLAGSLTSCYVATGSFSRTAVNFSAGCQTVVSNIVMAITVLFSLILFTKLLYYTPIAILASIILSALPGLIDLPEAYYIFKVSISFAKLLLNAIRPSVQLLGRLPRTDTFCEMSQFPMAIETPGILTIRINSALLCFANANFIRERITKWVTEEEDDLQEPRKKTVQVVILDMSNMMNIDTSGILALEELHKDLASHGIDLAMACPRWQVLHKLKLAKFVDRIGKGNIFLSVGEANDACVGRSKFGALSNC